MKFTTRKTQIKTIKQEDPRFHIWDEFIVAHRAGFEVDQRCPREYRMIISECIDRGWLKPVAYMTERELIFAGLNNDL